MWYVAMFAVLGILLVTVVLVRDQRKPGLAKSRPPRGTKGASRTKSGSAQRRERKRRRAQSKRVRRRRH